VTNVTIGVKNVPINHLNVNLVQITLTENPMPLVPVKKDIIMMVLKFVKNVIKNVFLVTIQIPVSNVKIQEIQPENVHVHMENSLMINGNVKIVVINVKLVKMVLINVNSASETESIQILVLAQLDSSMMEKLQLVNNVLTDVKLVKNVKLVILVPLEETEMIVTVQKEKLNNVIKKETMNVTKNVQIQLVNLVPSNVKNVKMVAPLIVKNVPETELIQTNVPAQMELMKIIKSIVQNVPKNVLLVKVVKTNVLHVPKEELIQKPDVSVKMDNTSMVKNKNVMIVLTNVPLVLLKKLVSNVLMKPEMMVQFVTVKITSMIMVLLNVQLVKINVISVSTDLITVPFVLMVELIHQNVISHHQLLKLLKLKISQSVLLKSLCVTINVPLVKELLITV